MAAIPLHREEIDYPTSDGQPMAETTLHRKIMTDLIQGLDRRYRDVPDVWVGGNLFFYYEEGRPQKVVAPDVLLVQGVRKWDRKIYKLWEEGRVPSLVIEVTSDHTRDEDLTKKKEIYQRLGVEEYFLFDPYGDYLDPRLQGERLERGRYVPMPPRPDGTLVSSTTGLILQPEGERLRLVDPVDGDPVGRGVGGAGAAGGSGRPARSRYATCGRGARPARSRCAAGGRGADQDFGE